MTQDVTLYAEIEKKDAAQHMVYGYASTEALDSQGEIVKKDALSDALADYMKYANIREMHQPKAIGKTKQATLDEKGLYIGVKVVDKDAWEKVEEGVYNGFSIGGRVGTMVDNEITALTLSEISLVDRPANPEAVFDVWKSDTKKAVKATLQKDIWGADRLVDLACNLSGWIMKEKAQGEATAELETALATIKSAITTELDEDEDYDVDQYGMFAYADKIVNLKKTDESKEEDKDTKEEAKVEEKIEEKVEEVKVEEKVEEKTDNVADIVKIVDAKIEKGEMATNEEVEALLKAQELPVNDKNVDMMRFELAGLIVKTIEANMQKTMNSDAAKKEAKKVLDDADVKDANTKEEKNVFKKILKLIDSAENEIKKADGDEYILTNQTPPAAPDSKQEDGNTAVSDDLVSLRSVVALLSSKNMGGALTDDELNALMNGVKGGSEVTSSQQTSPAPKDGNFIPGKQASDMAIELKKIEDTVEKKLEKKYASEIEKLQKEIEKMNNTPMPIKVRTSYQTVEKTEKNGDEAMLTGMEKRADELNLLMKADPNNTTLHVEAKNLSASIMKLRREKANG